jgi:hypothetical protein
LQVVKFIISAFLLTGEIQDTRFVETILKICGG